MADPALPELRKNDKALESVDFAKWYDELASDEALERTKAALEKKGHKCDVVASGKDVLKLLKKTIPKGASVMNGHSTSFNEIGLIDAIKKSEWKNLMEEILAEKDQGKAAELRRLASTADYWLSSASAVSEEGDIVVADLTGTRVAGFTAAKNVVVVVGAQKITPTYNAAAKRTKKFCLPVESARVRVAYGVPASTIANFLAIRAGNPFNSGRIHVIIVKEHLGF